jgi:hypothetical protein
VERSCLCRVMSAYLMTTSSSRGERLLVMHHAHAEHSGVLGKMGEHNKEQLFFLPKHVVLYLPIHHSTFCLFRPSSVQCPSCAPSQICCRRLWQGQLRVKTKKLSIANKTCKAHAPLKTGCWATILWQNIRLTPMSSPYTCWRSFPSHEDDFSFLEIN